jgi:hypothetical protein
MTVILREAHDVVVGNVAEQHVAPSRNNGPSAQRNPVVTRSTAMVPAKAGRVSPNESLGLADSRCESDSDPVVAQRQRPS